MEIVIAIPLLVLIGGPFLLALILGQVLKARARRQAALRLELLRVKQEARRIKAVERALAPSLRTRLLSRLRKGGDMLRQKLPTGTGKSTNDTGDMN